MTDAEQADQGMMRLAFPGIAYSYVEFPLGIDVSWVVAQMKAAEDAYRETFPPAAPVAGRSYLNGEPLTPRPPPITLQTPQAQYVPAYMTEHCNECGGPVAFKDGFTSKAGKPISASIMCAGSCKDQGKFPHHVRWIEREELNV